MFAYNQPNRNTGEMLREIFLSKNILSRLILINTVVFLFVNLVGLFMSLAVSTSGINPIVQFLALPANTGELLKSPWTLFTYMFLQEKFFHLIFNLIMLYFGGLIFQEYLSQKKLLWTYIIGGITGGLFFILAFNIFPAFIEIKDTSIALGASASVLAIIVGISTYVPDYSVHLLFFGRVKLKYMAIAFVVIDLLSIQRGNPGGHIAHLGGALWGFIYAYSLRRGNNLYGFLNNLTLPKFIWKKKEAKFKTSRPDNGRPMSDDEYNYKRAATQDEIDRILDKISKSGYSSLTSKEKELLFKTSNKK